MTNHATLDTQLEHVLASHVHAHIQARVASVWKLLFIKLACSLRLETIEAKFTFPLLFSNAKFTCSKQADLGFSCSDKPLVLVIVRCFISKIWQEVTFLSFGGGWSGLSDSFVLFGPQIPKAVVTSYAQKFSDDFVICDTDKEQRYPPLFQYVFILNLTLNCCCFLHKQEENYKEPLVRLTRITK